jgi:uncharacterized protein
VTTQRNCMKHRHWFVAFLLFQVLGTFTAGRAWSGPGTADSVVVQNPDVIVVGAGLAGLSAALEAGRAGAKVLVVDEASIFGGHAIMSGGEVSIVNTPLQRAEHIQDSADLAYQDFLKWGEDNDRGWVRYYVEHSKVEIYDWLTALGVHFHDLSGNWGNTVSRIHLTTGLGLGLVRPVYLECLRHSNISFVWNTEVTSLLTRSGIVAGVRGKSLRTDNAVDYSSKAVILATGGFQSNSALALAHWPSDLPKPPVLLAGSGVNSMGSGLSLATNAGAALSRLDHQWNYISGLPDPRYPGLNRGLSVDVEGILVNQNGEDFMPKRSASVPERLSIALHQPNATYWRIFDERAKADFWVSGTDWAKFETIQRVLLDDRSLINQASTLQELAEIAHLPVDALKASVSQHNRESKEGHRIETPPFYAAQYYPLARKSMGGISIDRQARVLNTSAQPIRGLYAAGEATGEAGINGKRALEGTFLGPAILTGRVAARAVIEDFSIRRSKQSMPIEENTAAETVSAAASRECLNCHQMQSMVDNPRRGFWHFERVHKLVLESEQKCQDCHGGMGEPGTVQHRIRLRAEAKTCDVCHQSRSE